jgi:prephenate dehydratase
MLQAPCTLNRGPSRVQPCRPQISASSELSGTCTWYGISYTGVLRSELPEGMPNNDGDASQTQTYVAYLGPEASFSHQAALAVFPTSNLHALPSFNSIFSALQSRKESAEGPTPDYAILPIENSTNGSVVQVLDLLARCSSEYPDLEVCAEHYLPVHHFLFTSNSTNTVHGEVNDNPSAKDPYYRIKTIYTHPQVWGQCTKFLSSQFPGSATEKLDVSSTSAAARLVAQDKSGSSAAICSSLAGELNTLKQLAANIEDDVEGNTTRFFVLRNKSRSSSPRAAAQLKFTTEKQNLENDQVDNAMSGNSGNREKSSVAQEVNIKSLILFTIPHGQPGSLSDALKTFATHDFNLTRIDARPSGRQPWHYVFFVECEEKRNFNEVEGEETGQQHRNLKRVLDALTRVTERVEALGSWRDMLQ